MKKLFYLLLCGAMLAGFTACENEEPNTPNESEGNGNNTENSDPTNPNPDEGENDGENTTTTFEVTFDAPTVGEQGTSGTGSEITKTVNGVTLTIDKGYSQVNSTEYEPSQIRIYANAIMNISASSNITKIVINTKEPKDEAGKHSASALSASAGNYSVNEAQTVGTWTGSTTSIDFTASLQARIISIIVTVGGEGGTTNPDPEEPEVEIPSISNVNYGEATYYEEYNTENAYNFSLDLMILDETGESIIGQYVIFDFYSTSATAIAGTYTTEDGSMGEYSIFYPTEGDDYYSITSASLTLEYTGQDDYGYNIYNVIAEFVSEGETYNIYTTLIITGWASDSNGGYNEYSLIETSASSAPRKLKSFGSKAKRIRLSRNR